MGGIAGFCDYLDDLTNEAYLWGTLAKRMADRIKRRGPDGDGLHVSAHAAFAHVRLAVVDPARGAQPMTRVSDGYRYTIVYDGELYNAAELKYELQNLGVVFETCCDTEILLQAYIRYGPACAEKLNGIYAFAVDDERRSQTFLCRDRFGVKPLFYTEVNGRLVFASEIKALFEYPGLNPVLGRDGLCEIFGLGPVRTPGNGVFCGVRELLPGTSGVFNQAGFRMAPYFHLRRYVHTASYAATVHHVRLLLEDIVARQMQSDAPGCALLCDGLSSHIVAALVSEQYCQSGTVLSAYSFGRLEDGMCRVLKECRATEGEAYPPCISDLLGISHHEVDCGDEALAALLYDAVSARDLPGMMDNDPSLLYFGREIKKRHTVGLYGACADEIFCQSPSLSSQPMWKRNTFPWLPDLSLRESLLKPEIVSALQLPAYVQARYEEAMARIPHLSGETPEEGLRWGLSFLNIQWVVAALLEWVDRCGMASGLEIRVPFMDHRLVEYLFNVPWEYKHRNTSGEGLLYDVARSLLPEPAVRRDKGSFQKRSSPAYGVILKDWVSLVLRDPQQPIHALLSEDAVKLLLRKEFAAGRRFGQTEAGPQLLAYLLQINFWLKKYDIEICL